MRVVRESKSGHEKEMDKFQSVRVAVLTVHESMSFMDKVMHNSLRD